MLRPDRLLEEQRIVRRQSVPQLDRLIRFEDLGMRIEGELERRRTDPPQLSEPVSGRFAQHAPAPGMQVLPIGA